MTNDTYFETLAEALNGVNFAAHNRDAVINFAAFDRATDQIPALYAATTDRAVYCTHSFSVPLDSLKGKPTKKWFHVSIYRMDSGRYELTTYIL